MNPNQNNKVIVILGATSSGKSSLAIKLAKQFDGEIISVDSRQIFKDMNLGTGKVEGRWEKIENQQLYIYKKIPHYLIDFVSPEDEYNVSHFKKDCEFLILDILKKGKVPILCGGTGFWIQAVVDNVIFPQIKPNQELRKLLQNKSANDLYMRLEGLDPERAGEIDKKNIPRLIRAIEIAQELGKVPKIKIDRKSNQRKIMDQTVEFLQIGIPVDKLKLTNKIETRLKERFRDGMLQEILALFENYKLSEEKLKNFGIAYSLVPLYKKGTLTKKELFDQICKFERKYSKRQTTWFKKDPRIFWSKEYKTIETKIRNFLK